jgi:hypothetical protein
VGKVAGDAEDCRGSLGSEASLQGILYEIS